MRRGARNESWEGVSATETRVLLECRAEASPSIVAGVIEREGYVVRICEGPDRRHRCTLVADGACALVNGADVVVHLLDRSEGAPSADVLPALAAERRPVAMVAETEASRRRRSDEPSPVPWHAETVRSPLTRRDLVAAIRRALGRRDEPPAIWGDGFC